jgi:hypothetical protein
MKSNKLSLEFVNNTFYEVDGIVLRKDGKGKEHYDIRESLVLPLSGFIHFLVPHPFIMSSSPMSFSCQS